MESGASTHQPESHAGQLNTCSFDTIIGSRWRFLMLFEFAPLMRARLCLIFCAGLGEQMLDAGHVAQSVLSVERSVLDSCYGGCCSDCTGAEHLCPALRWHGAPAGENASWREGLSWREPWKTRGDIIACPQSWRAAKIGTRAGISTLERLQFRYQQKPPGLQG